MPMLRPLKVNDIKPELSLATYHVKNLIIAGVNGDEDFPKLLGEQHYITTKDYNMACAIVAFYVYCMRSKNQKFRRFAQSVAQSGSNSQKLFEYLKEGNGKKVKDCMRFKFTEIMDEMLQQSFPGEDNEIKRSKIIEKFKNRVEKITAWIMNGDDVCNLIDKFLGNQKEELKNLNSAKAKLKAAVSKLKSEDAARKKRETEQKVAEERAAKEAKRAAEEQAKKGGVMASAINFAKRWLFGSENNTTGTEDKKGVSVEKSETKEVNQKHSAVSDDVVGTDIQQNQIVNSLLETAAQYMQHCHKSVIIDSLKVVAAHFEFIKKELQESEYKKKLPNILKIYSKKLSEHDKELTDEQKEALFKNIINSTAEAADGKVYFEYFVDDQKKKVELNSWNGITLGDLVDFDSLKNKCPIAFECNVVDHAKASETLIKEYDIHKLFEFLVTSYFGKNGVVKADFSKDLKFKPFAWGTLGQCRWLGLSLDLMICLSDLKIITK